MATKSFFRLENLSVRADGLSLSLIHIWMPEATRSTESALIIFMRSAEKTG